MINNHYIELDPKVNATINEVAANALLRVEHGLVKTPKNSVSSKLFWRKFFIKLIDKILTGFNKDTSEH